jgi:hypothetical protein
MRVYTCDHCGEVYTPATENNGTGYDFCEACYESYTDQLNVIKETYNTAVEALNTEFVGEE